IPYPTGRFFLHASQALRARLRSVGPYGTWLAAISHQPLARIGILGDGPARLGVASGTVCRCRPIYSTHKTIKENTMSKSASTSSVYRVTELIGTSESSWEDAAKHAVETATKTLRDLRIAEVNKLDLVIVDGKVAAFRARVNLSFKYEEKE